MTFELGTTHGGYEFLDVLQMSKMEVAYRVRNTLAQRLEVLRVLPASVREDTVQVERFLRESRVHAKLVHPNIVAFYAALELERQFVITTEYVEGPTLADRLQLGPMDWPEAVTIACGVLSALACAHRHGVIHRDVTPSNVVLPANGPVKLAGFGLAKQAAGAQLTQVGTVVGTLKYISPEQVKADGSIDLRSDLYSLGCVLYEAITGRAPFDSQSQFELMLAHVSEAPKPPSELARNIPEALNSAIVKALAKDRAGRQQSADEFRLELEAARSGMPRAEIEAEPAESKPREPETTGLPAVEPPATEEQPAAQAEPPAPAFLFQPASSWPSRSVMWIGAAAFGLGAFLVAVFMAAGQ